MAVLCATVTVLTALSQTASAADARPNILFALSDDQSYPHASILGDPVVKTPAFDRVAREGVLFTHSFTACPSCTPSRSAILTGRQIWQIGEAGLLFGTLHPEHPLLTHKLQDAGYHVGYVGKPWAPGDWKAAGLTRHPNGREYAAQLEPDPPIGIDTRDYAANFEDFLADRPADAPFFFWFGCTEPHREYDIGIGARSGLSAADIAVPPYLPDAPETRSEMLDYYYEIEHFDKHLARMLERLEQLGELDDTIVVVTSDNGMPFSRTKTTLYDGGVRMPTAIRWGSSAPGGRRVDDFISHIDFAPTFLEAASVDPPGTLTGRSLLSLLRSDRSGRIEEDRNQVVTGLEELYDVRADPHQMKNLADDSAYADVKREYWARLKEHLQRTHDPRLEGQDPWQDAIYRQVDGFGATYNMSLSDEQRHAASRRGKHAVSPGAKE